MPIKYLTVLTLNKLVTEAKLSNTVHRWHQRLNGPQNQLFKYVFNSFPPFSLRRLKRRKQQNVNI